MLDPSYRDKNRRLKENASRRRPTRPARRRRMDEDFNMIPAPFRKYLKIVDINAEDYDMEDFDIGNIVTDYDGDRYTIVNFLDAIPDYEEIMHGGERRFLLVQSLSDKKYYVVEPEYDGNTPKVIPVDINLVRSYFYEAISRRRSPRKRCMNESYDKVLWVDYEGEYFDRLQDEGIINFGDVVEEVKNIVWEIAPEATIVIAGYQDLEVRELTQEEYDKLEDKLPKYIREWYQDLLDENGIDLWESVSCKRRNRPHRKRRMNEDSEERNCTFDVDYEGDYFSDLSSRGIIDFNDVFEKVQDILYFKYPEAYAVKVGYDEIEVRNLTEDDCEFIEDDVYRDLVNWYQDIEEHGNPNRRTESVSRKR